jgi:hypothetical protein
MFFSQLEDWILGGQIALTLLDVWEWSNKRTKRSSERPE